MPEAAKTPNNRHFGGLWHERVATFSGCRGKFCGKTWLMMDNGRMDTLGNAVEFLILYPWVELLYLDMLTRAKKQDLNR